MNCHPEPLPHVLTRPLVAEPGQQFNYNGGLTQAMAAVVQRASKTPFQAYARERLLSRWASPTSSGWELWATCRRPRRDSGCASVIWRNLARSHFWWYARQQTPVGLTEARLAGSYGGQQAIVYPGLKMAVTFLAGCYNGPAGPSVARKILRENVLPAVKTDIRTGCPGLGS